MESFSSVPDQGGKYDGILESSIVNKNGRWEGSGTLKHEYRGFIWDKNFYDKVDSNFIIMKIVLQKSFTFSSNLHYFRFQEL